MQDRDRQRRIDEMIKSEGCVTFERIMTALKVSAPTIKRDLRYMREQLGYPIKYSYQQRGYVYERTNQKTETSQKRFWYSTKELRVLLDMIGLLGQLETDKASVLQKELKPLKARVKGVLEVTRDNSEELQKYFKIYPSQYLEFSSEYFDLISLAIVRRLKLQFTYKKQPNGDAPTRTVSPIRMLNYRGRWYLQGSQHTKGDEKTQVMRTFAIDQIFDPVMLSDSAEEVSPEVLQRLDSAFGVFVDGELKTAVLKFDAKVAFWLNQQQWHQDQTKETDEAGCLILRVPYYNSIELKGEILKWGENVEVLAPESLREEIRQEIKKMQEKYSFADGKNHEDSSDA